MNINLTLIGQSIAMLVFVWFCMTKIWPLVMKGLEERRAKIAEGLAAADNAERELAEAKSSAQQMVTEARAQAGQIRDQANQQASQIVAEAKGQGVQEKDRQLTLAKSEIEQEKNRARDELRAKVAMLSVAGAEKILQREIDADKHRDLLDQVAAEL